ncbi:MAG: ABC transporter ATP-binding protein [Gammaproteobacteria bacterium]
MSFPLEIKNLTKSYGGKTALSNLSFRIEPGHIVGLLGVNGAGKSTLIKCLLDLIDFESGEIQIFGQAHTETTARRQLSYLGEQFAPPNFATGNDVLRLLTGIEGLTFPTTAIREQCELLALEHAVLDTPCQSFSKGMRQKLGLIACLVAAKPLLVLDEPMSGLDPLARRLFKDRILAQRDLQRTVFFSTHLLEDVESVCDRVIILDAGELRFSGSISALLESTKQSNLEAAFLAAINRQRAA